MKKIISTALLAIIPLTLVGCTNNGNSKSNASSSTGSTTKVISHPADDGSSSVHGKSVKDSSLWNNNKDNQLANFMVSWNKSMNQSYTQCTPNRNTTYTGLHYPNDFTDNKMAFNDRYLSAGWSTDGSDAHDVNVVAIYEDTNGGSTVGGRIYLFAIQNNSPVVYYTEQNQGTPDGLVHFETTQNTDLTNEFKKLVTNKKLNPETTNSNRSTKSESTSAPLTFDEGMQILQQSNYKNYLNESPKLVSSDKQQLVISSLAGAKGINYFTLTLEKTIKLKSMLKWDLLREDLVTNSMLLIMSLNIRQLPVQPLLIQILSIIRMTN
ncbi:DUF4767 domain-containing protein [Pediococcus pentosaceus]|uniref:DUF4767 domain-containing protein n=1 Tax=Pediococcus pentosaceus TaxID=1255 RepID=UPI00223C2D9C|nr:DUF4767 domain-containing protein [Pediococcus pentosaceus]